MGIAKFHSHPGKRPGAGGPCIHDDVVLKPASKMPLLTNIYIYNNNNIYLFLNIIYNPNKNGESRTCLLKAQSCMACNFGGKLYCCSFNLLGHLRT